MTRYLVVLGIIALSVGALFRGAATNHLPLLKMAGTIGILMFGAIGTMALQRWQATGGRKEVEAALLALGDGFIITDWSEGNGPPDAPDYVVVAPGGVAAVTVDTMPNAGRSRRAEARVVRARQRAQEGARWVRERLPAAGWAAAKAVAARPAGGSAVLAGEAVTVAPILVLTRRLAEPDQPGEVPVINPDGLEARVRTLAVPERLSLEDRYRITRALRQAAERARR